MFLIFWLIYVTIAYNEYTDFSDFTIKYDPK